MKRLLGLAVIGAGVTLAVIIGQRMSTDAMAVAIGVVFGVAASIPTSLLIVAATRGRRPEPAYRQPDFLSSPMPAPPQIYIMNPSGGVGQPAPWLPGGLPAQLPMPPSGYFAQEPSRRYKVVGEDEHWLDCED
jgi:hypothetical protein